MALGGPSESWAALMLSGWINFPEEKARFICRFPGSHTVSKCFQRTGGSRHCPTQHSGEQARPAGCVTPGGVRGNWQAAPHPRHLALEKEVP